MLIHTALGPPSPKAKQAQTLNMNHTSLRTLESWQPPPPCTGKHNPEPSSTTRNASLQMNTQASRGCEPHTKILNMPPHQKLDLPTLPDTHGKAWRADVHDDVRKPAREKNWLHFSICACHPCAGAMLIFSVSFQFSRMIPEGNPKSCLEQDS